MTTGFDNAEKLGAHEVAAWLRRHPAFLQQFPDLALTLVVPRENGPAASLASYQLEVLRDKNRELSRRLQELFGNAQENERLAVRTHQLTLALMNEKTCIINTSRGALIDTASLADALKAGKIFGAALDVIDKEPISDDCPLRGLNNVILSDHTGWYSEASVRSLQEKAAQAAIEMLTTGFPTQWVNQW